MSLIIDFVARATDASTRKEGKNEKRRRPPQAEQQKTKKIQCTNLPKPASMLPRESHARATREMRHEGIKKETERGTGRPGGVG